MNKLYAKSHYLVYLTVVFFNSFVDLGHKVLIQDIFYQTSSPQVFTIMSAIVNAMILLPYILIYTPSGFIADKFSKTAVMQITALAAIPLTILITVFYYLGYFWLSFSMTLLLAIQSTLNSPAKYGYIKEMFGKEKLAEVNGYVQTTVIIAILAGTFLFSALFQHILHINNLLTASVTKSQILKFIAPLGFLLILGSAFEAFCTLFLRPQNPAEPKATFSISDYLKFKDIAKNVRLISANKMIFICIIALSVFWGINQVIIANYGAYLKEYVNDASVLFAQGSLAFGGIGVLLGALYAGRISKNFIEAGLIPLGCIGMTLGLFCIPLVISKMLIITLFFCYGFFSGVLIVPLNALIQFNSPDEKLGRILAGNNFSQNIFMFVFLVITAISAIINFNSILIFRFIFIIAALGTIYFLLKFPQSLIRYLTYSLITKVYRLHVSGIKNIPSAGGVLLLGNHTSYLDWAILQITCPRPIRFVLERSIYNRWYLKWMFELCRYIPISSDGSRNALTLIKEALQQGDVVALFPESYISRNGQLGKFHRGYELAIKDVDAVIVPFYIRGLWGSVTSLSTARYKKISKHLIRHVTICYGNSLLGNTMSPELKSEVFKLSLRAWSIYADSLPSIPTALLYRIKQQKNNIVAIESKGKKFNGLQMIVAFIRLRSLLKTKIFKLEKRVGIMLPASFAGVLVNQTLLALSKVVVNLNYMADKEALQHSIKTAELKTIITSRLFINKLTSRGFDVSWISEYCNVIYLDDHQDTMQSQFNWLRYFVIRFTPAFILNKLYVEKQNPNEVAVIYFTSGSEGLPKGVELSHKNILVNAKQTSCVINIEEGDSVLSCLPLSDAFGLTVTSFMPLIEGVVAVFHPDPTDALGVAKAVARHNVTLLCATPNFLNLYVRNPKVHTLMFKSLRLVVAGAEKLSQVVAKQFYYKFALNILEGYGATETAPIISLNLPDILLPEYWYVQQGYKAGSVGMPLPGTHVMIVDPKTFTQLPIDKEGMVVVTGPQVMKGYLNTPEKTTLSLIDKEGTIWYVTGDKGYIDEDGYIFIVDRYSRFAKVASEIISLLEVENAVRPLLNEEAECVAVNLPDEKKGEKILLLVANDPRSADEIRREIMKEKISPFMVPAEVHIVQAIPKLGSGKVDFVKCKAMAAEELCSPVN